MTLHPHPKPAATLVLWSELSEVVLLKRSSQSGFMAGAHVFPGGVVDESDFEWAREQPHALQAYATQSVDGLEDPSLALAYFMAAIRETAEECGILLLKSATGEPLPRAKQNTLVDAIFAGENFNQILHDNKLKPNIKSLLPLSWWITPTIEKRRYDTRFFWAPLPGDQVMRVNENESSSGCLLTPRQALHDYQEGKIFFAPPTIATLELLSEFGSPNDLSTLFPRPTPAICPETGTSKSGNLVLLLPGDPEHSNTRIRGLKTRTRFELTEAGRFV